MTNNKEQTAVEWYDNQLRKVFSNTTEASNFSHEELLQQAKEMHKKESIAFALHYTFGHQEVSDQIKGNLEKLYNQYFEGDK
jgi:enoyl-[acyl-carrier-protein] reductase (NADH)